MSNKKTTINVQGTAITVLSQAGEGYISLTDMVKAKDGDFFISDWLRNRNTVEFLGIWESVFNPGFNYGEFATIKSLVLANIEAMNTEFIHMSLAQGERLKRLNQIAIRQMRTLTATPAHALPGAKDEAS